MKIKLIYILPTFLFLASTFNAYALDLDPVEKEILGDHRQASQLFSKDSERTSTENGGMHVTKAKFCDGRIMKTVFDTPYETQKKGFMSLKMAGQVITEGRETIILEHLWVNAAGFPLVKSYTTGERSEELGYAWSLQYHGIENTASVHQLWPREIEEYLNLVIADLQSTSVLGPMGTKVFNLNIEAPSNHSDVLSASNLWGIPGVRLTNSLRVFSRS